MATDLLIELSRFVQQIAAIAKTGLAFRPGPYDSERYEQIIHQAAALSTLLAGSDRDEAARLSARWLAEVGDGASGYVTPTAGVGAVVFNERDELLMVKRLSGGWHYPGGFCEVGLSPAENAIKEVLEETGIKAHPLRLMAVLDTLKRGTALAHMYVTLFYCRAEGGELRVNSAESLDAGFFPLDRLPEPMHIPNRRWLEVAREFHFAGRQQPYFDPL